MVDNFEILENCWERLKHIYDHLANTVEMLTNYKSRTTSARRIDLCGTLRTELVPTRVKTKCQSKQFRSV